MYKFDNKFLKRGSTLIKKIFDPEKRKNLQKFLRVASGRQTKYK